MELVDFLLARIAEDEVAANVAGGDGETWATAPHYSASPGSRTYVSVPGAFTETIPADTAVHIARWHPQRVLADCRTRRRIAGLGICTACAIEHQPCGHQDATLRLLALPYADHPDYDPTWGLQ